MLTVVALKTLVIWTGILILAVINRALREFVLIPQGYRS
ncbi:hypothetical protein VRRI112168_20195 [Vreelandella rituensis]